MSQKFYNVIDHLLINEGGYVNHFADPGGHTIYGVTWKNWIEHLKRYSGSEHYTKERWDKFITPDGQGLPRFTVSKFKLDDFKALQPSDVKFFYYKEYWEKCKADELPDGIDYYAFDFSVHSGVSQAVKILQRIVGAFDDGIIGERTLNAVHKYCERNGNKRLLKEYDRSRREFLSRLRNASFFLKGWYNRLNKVLEKCYEILNDVYIDTTKPLSQSKTIATASTEAKIAVGTVAVGTLAPNQENMVQVTEKIVGNLQTVDALNSVIRNLYAYGWLIPSLLMLGFAGYYAYIRRNDWFNRKE